MKILVFPNREEGFDSTLDITLDEIKKVALSNNKAIEIYDDLCEIEKNYMNNSFKTSKILFILSLNKQGMNLDVYKFLNTLRQKRDGFENSYGAIITIGKTDLYTKSISRELGLSANFSGLSLIGKSLVEKVSNFKNFRTSSMIFSLTKEEAYISSINTLTKKLNKKIKFSKDKAKLLALHTSHFPKSNTLNLWKLVRNSLNENIEITEINLDTRSIQDCRGCKHETCMHYAKEESCYYGGFMVKELYPKVLEADGIVLICPNYNDSTGANITAFINRLTALYKMHNFENKYIFCVIVSGYSGGDIVASQVLGAFNMNKGFILPPYFALVETANLAGEIYSVEKIENKAEEFAINICKTFGMLEK